MLWAFLRNANLSYPSESHLSLKSFALNKIYSNHCSQHASITFRQTPRKRLRLEIRFLSLTSHFSISQMHHSVKGLWNSICTFYLQHIIIWTSHSSSSQPWHWLVANHIGLCSSRVWIQPLPLSYQVTLGRLVNLSRSHKVVLCIKWYIICKSFNIVLIHSKPSINFNH